jgi:queuine tRNA-ribosyltransferase
MSGSFAFKVSHTNGKARRGEITTPHGLVQTPAFMPVGTAGTVKAMYTDQVRETGADVVLGNVYHLMLRPTAERVARLGGLHKFMRWPHTILTDSGGFQIMSLGALRKLTEEGVTFKSHIDGAKHDLSPERSMEIQSLLGSDIQMQLDECLKLPAERSEVIRAMELSARWAERSKAKFEALGGPDKGQGLYGIVQGGTDIELRLQSVKLLTDIGFWGYSVGGLGCR